MESPRSTRSSEESLEEHAPFDDSRARSKEPKFSPQGAWRTVLPYVPHKAKKSRCLAYLVGSRCTTSKAIRCRTLHPGVNLSVVKGLSGGYGWRPQCTFVAQLGTTLETKRRSQTCHGSRVQKGQGLSLACGLQMSAMAITCAGLGAKAGRAESNAVGYVGIGMLSNFSIDADELGNYISNFLKTLPMYL
ncbi:hypothetical protein DM02DRAFT_626040 [Periconia macrospinosa]|uniref:Uncharacterized protein n=1 Tax=Periconia macrospinosa TaxID=97972 RepID=A0A2V1DYN3_9PLEO|nr:hypothetical protein DM02DRAFT_626040 [Periconia macrospinosa]